MMFRFIGLAAFVAAALSQPIEFASFEKRLPDPCVNQFPIDGTTLSDCPAGSQAPAAGNTFLIPSTAIIAPATSGVFLTLNGNFFPTGSSLVLSQANVDSCTAATIDATTAVPLASVTLTSSTLRFEVPASWMLPSLEWERLPRKVCLTYAGVPAQWTGFRVGVVWNCDNNNRLCSARVIPTTLSSFDAAVERAKTTCCLSNPGVQGPLVIGQCINPNVESCCGSTALVPSTKCCSDKTETVAWIDGTCPCRSTSGDADCPSGESCCLRTKYTELTTAAFTGQCYSPRKERCCDTGSKYDPGTSQCCSINGVQSLNTPCPCSRDTDCLGGQNGLQLTDLKCCTQTAPVPVINNPSPATRCNKYLNYPSGTGAAQNQQCAGWCFDSRYQICCNGVQCRRQFEKCCNNTCCNMFNGTCSPTYLPRNPTSTRFNWQEYNVVYEICTVVEQLNPVNSFWVFILPTALLAATIAGLALALVFASKVEHKARRALEKMMLTAAVVAVLNGIPTFFSPAYKYGSVILVISLFAIVTAAARKVKIYLVSLVLHLILFIYLWDPFHGNDYLTLASDRTPFGRPDPRTAGLLHTVSRMHDSSMGNGHNSEIASVAGLTPIGQEVNYMEDACYKFYDYFRLDPILRDTVRYDDPNVLFFGFCSRGWIIAILIAQGFVMIAVLAQILLTLVALLVRGGLLQRDFYYSGAGDFDDDVSSRSS